MLTESERITGAFAMERPALSAGLANEYVSQMAIEGRRFLSGQHRVMEDERRLLWLPKQASTPAAPEIKPAGDFERFAKSQEASFRLKPLRVPPIDLKTNTRIICPPYDLGWTEGIGVASKGLGQLSAMRSQGFNAGGLGLHLSSPEPVFATIAPVGHYAFTWASFENSPGLGSTGGLGVTVYKGGSIAPVLNRRTTLWRVFSPPVFAGGNGEGPLSDVHTGDGVPVPQTLSSLLVPISLDMEAGAKYLVWIWLWQVAALPRDEAAFLALLKCDVPAVSITTSPPNVQASGADCSQASPT